MCAAINLAPALARRSPQQGLLVAAALAVQGLRRARRREVAVRGRRVAVRGLAAAALALVRVRAEAVECLLYTSPSSRDKRQSRMPSSA